MLCRGNKGRGSFSQRNSSKNLEGLKTLKLNLDAVMPKPGLFSRGSYNNKRYEKLMTHSNVSLSDSLLQVPFGRELSAKELFNSILDYMQTTNGTSRASHKAELIEKILHRGRADDFMEQELYLQLIKQTRGCPDVDRAKNAWKLLSVVAQSLPCPKEVSKMVRKYVHSVALDKHEDPYIRSRAAKVRIIFKHNRDGSEISERDLLGNLSVCQVQLLDDSVVDVIYDSNMSMRDAIEHLGWELGITNLKYFSIFIDMDGDHSRLDPDKNLADVCGYKIFSTEGTRARLLFKKDLFRSADKSINDPDYNRISFIQARWMYLNGGYFVAEESAIHLCLLLIMAKHGHSIFHHTAKLARVIAENIPSQVYQVRPEEEWMADILHCFRNFDLLNQEEAISEFLTAVRRIPYGNCNFFKVRSTEHFAVDIPPNTELRMGINRSGTSFLLPNRPQSILSVKLSRVAWCKLSSRTLSLKIGRFTEWCSISLTTYHGDEICRLISKHKKDYNRNRSSDIRANVDLSALLDASTTALLQGHALSVIDDDEEHAEEIPQVTPELSADESEEEAEEPESPPRAPMPQSPFEDMHSPTEEEEPVRQSHRRRHERPSGSMLSAELQPVEIIEEVILEKGQLQPIEADEVRASMVLCEQAILPLDELQKLVPGVMFSKRYRIEAERLDGKNTLFFAKSHSTRADVAIKFTPTWTHFENSEYFFKVLARSQFVCNLIETIKDSERFPPCLVLERGEYDLNQWLKKENPSQEERKEAIRQVLLALQDIHSRGVVHCDLEPENVVFFKAENKWKLIDFDSAARSGFSSEINATLSYASPEIVRGEKEGRTQATVDTSADMWSFGILAFEVLTNHRFYPTDMSAIMVRDTLLGNLQLPPVHGLDEIAADLVNSLIVVDPSLRLTASQCLEHTYFSTLA